MHKRDTPIRARGCEQASRALFLGAISAPFHYICGIPRRVVLNSYHPCFRRLQAAKTLDISHFSRPTFRYIVTYRVK